MTPATYAPFAAPPLKESAGRLVAAAESLTQRRVRTSGGVEAISLQDWDRNVPLP